MNPLPEKCLWFKWSRNRNVGKIELSKCFYCFLDKAIRNVLLRSCIPTWCPLIHDHLLMNTILTVLLYFCLELDQNFVRSHFSDQREGSNLQMLPKNFLKFSLKIIFIFRSVSSKSMWFALCVFTVFSLLVFTKSPHQEIIAEIPVFYVVDIYDMKIYFFSVGHGVGTNINPNTASLNPSWNYDFDIDFPGFSFPTGWKEGWG